MVGVPIPPALYSLDIWDTDRNQSSIVLLPRLTDNFASAILVQALLPLRELDEQQSMSPRSLDDEKERAHPHLMLENSGKTFFIGVVTSFSLASVTDHRRPRPYDTAPSTRRTCHVSLVLSGILTLSSLAETVALGTTLVKAANADELVNVISAELVSTGCVWSSAVPLVFATIIALCTESLGLVHTISLCWALWREGRLAHQSQITGLSILVTVVTYTAASQVFIVNQFTAAARPELNTLTFSVTALAVMTFGLFSLTTITTWLFLAMRHHALT